MAPMQPPRPACLACARNARSTWLLAATLGALSHGCAHAPPPRFSDVGAPGRLEQGDFEIAAAGYPAMFFGEDQLLVAASPTIALAAADWVSFEVGGEFARGLGSWDLGQLGLRMTALGRTRSYEPGEEPADALGLLDFDFGGGLGRSGDGGELADHRSVLAGGTYFGLGTGVNVDWFTWYARGRGGISGDAAGNLTAWWSVLTGVEFMIADHLAVWISGGGAGDLNVGLFNAATPAMGGIQWGGGLAFHFNMLRDDFGEPEPEQTPQAPAPAAAPVAPPED